MTQKGKGGLSNETFDEFLVEQETHSVKELIAEQLSAAMAQEGLTKVQMAARMKISRWRLDRLFDLKIPSVTVDTLRRAANAVGRSLRIDLVCRLDRRLCAGIDGRPASRWGQRRPAARN